MVTKTAASKQVLITTPPIPKDLPQVELTENARQVLVRRYVRRGDQGEPVESVEEMFWRVAYHIAGAEQAYRGDVLERARQFYALLTSKKFFPNSPTFTGAGTPLGQLAACFTATMRVTTDQGVKPIADLQIGDRVLTHAGSYEPVTQLSRRAYDGELLRIKVKLIGTTLEVTPEHPILTDHGWVKAGKLKVGDKLAIGHPKSVHPKPQFDLAESVYAGELELQINEEAVRVRRPSSYQNSGRQAEWTARFVDLTPDLARLCGYYVSEGSIDPEERYVRFVFSKDEVDYQKDVVNLVKDIFGVRCNQTDSNYGNWTTLNFYSRPFAAWLHTNFGSGAGKKRIPVWLQFADVEIQEAFLIGMMRGDGLFFEKTYVFPSRPQPHIYRALRLTLSNPGLIQQTWQMALRLGYDAAIQTVDTTYVTPNANETGQIRLPPLQSRDLVKKAFNIELPEPDRRYIHKSVSRQEDQIFFEIEKVTRQQFDGTVYNCEVASEHTYVTEGIVVHNCFVLPISDDMGRRSDGIFQSLRDAALIQQTGGGNGFSFSRLRPKGTLVKSSAGQATGPVGFLRVYDHAFGEVAQGGSRRGANMAVLRVDHPDIEEFISCKTDENQITNFNISVGITDAFMKAVREDADWDLRFPDVTSPKYRGFNGTLEQAAEAGIPLKTYKTVRARALFEKIVKQAHHNGEPGMLFLDAANRGNPVPHLYQLESTNPCFIGSTRIATDQGLVAIEDLAGKESLFLVANDERAPKAGQGPAGDHPGVVYRTASLAWKTRENVPVLHLVTSHGYSITATPDHKFLTSERGYVELAELKPGDRLLLQSGEGTWNRDDRLPNIAILREKMATMAQAGNRAGGPLVTRHDFQERYANLPKAWSHELGVVLGCLVGDGWFSPSSNAPVGMVFNYKADELYEVVHGALCEYFGEGHLHERTSVRQLTYGRLPYHFFESLGITAAPAHQKRVPTAIWQAPRPAVVGFLQGLFTTAGTINLSLNKKSCSVRLASSSPELLREVQLILINFGIVSSLHQRREEGFRLFPDGKGGHRDYFAHADYELIIDKKNRDIFAAEIGFLDAHKQQKVEHFIMGKARRSNVETYCTTVVSVEDAGCADVYDLTEPQTHSVIANGLVAHQCGEQFLGSYESCCLGSVNLNEHCGPDGQVDWESLRHSVELSTRFLDDVVDANAYVPAVPQLKEAAQRARRIGLGIMGLADMMYHVGVRYGSPEGQEFGAQVIEFVRYHAVRTSIQLAGERGAFPAIKGSVYDPGHMTWIAPQALNPYTRDWGRPALDWKELVHSLQKHGIRNAAQTTVAPTGTIATIAGCEGYGCEPVFALAYVRHVNDNGKDLQLTYASPRFDAALEKAGIAGEARQEIVERVMLHGTCQNIPEVPEAVRDVFVVAADISAEEHVRMQAALQAFVDNSLSKTINFPENAPVDDVASAYLLAWELGCKGITVYVTGSRTKVVLETKATAEKVQSGTGVPLVQTWSTSKEAAPKDFSSAEIASQVAAWHESKKPRPRALIGRTFRVETPLGKAFITVNENGGGHPFEVFINTAKAGSETAAVSEAIGRLISYILRLASPILPRERMAEVVRQLSGIGGGRSLGFGPNRVRSLPDGVGQVLDEYLQGKTRSEVTEGEEGLSGDGYHGDEQPEASPRQTALKMGDLCPECGEATMVNEEGCRKCYTCGFSEC